MRHPIQCAVIFALGMLVLSAQASGAGSGRQTIIQGVRDDVRRKIQQNEKAAGPSAAHRYGRQLHHSEPPRRPRSRAMHIPVLSCATTGNSGRIGLGP